MRQSDGPRTVLNHFEAVCAADWGKVFPRHRVPCVPASQIDEIAGQSAYKFIVGRATVRARGTNCYSEVKHPA